MDNTSYKIILVGPANSGKTTFFNKILNNTTYDKRYMPTIGVDYGVKHINYDNKKIILKFWDTAGQERFNSIVSSFFKKINMAILIYDLTDPYSKKQIIYWLDLLKRESGNIPVILIENKLDLIKNYYKKEEIDIPNNYNIIKTFNTSFKNDDTTEIIEYILNYIKEDVIITENLNTININNSTKKKSCCYF